MVDVQLANLQQVRVTIAPIWTSISREYLQHLIESMPEKIKAVLRERTLTC